MAHARRITGLNDEGKTVSVLVVGKVLAGTDMGIRVWDIEKKESIQTKNIIIATGSVVRPIPGFETDGVRVVNSDHILELKDVPKSLIVMGAGAVGVEFASVFKSFGAEVTILEGATPEETRRLLGISIRSPQ